MSFILDALKKSENDRQRATGPAIFEVRVAPPRSRLPLIAAGVGVLLLINLVVVAWIMLRKPAGNEATAAVAPPPIPGAVAQAPAPALAPPVAQPAPVLTEPAELSDEQTVPADVAPIGDDYAPAAEPGEFEPEPPSQSSTVTRGSVVGLPSYEKAKQDRGGRIPELRLDMHVYSPRPQERFVFLNMRKLKEGESLPDGVRVETITNDGAVLSYQGSKFTLERE
jgi:general secretion pathway protein B